MNLERQGVVLLNNRLHRIMRGLPAVNPRTSVDDHWGGRHRDWSVIKTTPKSPTWAMSTHSSAKKLHRIRFALTATHKSGYKVSITVWRCAARCSSPISIGERPGVKQCFQCSKPEEIPREVKS